MGIRRFLIFFALVTMLSFIVISTSSTDPNIIISWSFRYGGTLDDFANAIIQTNDGGFAIVGETSSYSNGISDVWLVKFNSSGYVLWNQTYGGSSWDYAEAIVQLDSGEFLIGGTTGSYGTGEGNCYLLKTSSNGSLLWETYHGGEERDTIYDMVVTEDGGIVVAGGTEIDVVNEDMWLVKFDSTGNYEWDTVFGGTGFDIATSLTLCADGGYALAGWSRSFSGDEADFYLVKSDVNGSLEWNRTFGGALHDAANSLIQTKDGGFALTGAKYSNATGESDMWLVKTNHAGFIEWEESYNYESHNLSYDAGTEVIQTTDEGFAVVGYTSQGGMWLVRTNASGYLVWDQVFGDSEYYYAQAVVQTSPSTFVIAGQDHRDYSTRCHEIWILAMTDTLNRSYPPIFPDLAISPGWGFSLVVIVVLIFFYKFKLILLRKGVG